MDYTKFYNLDFNPSPATIFLVDVNSCFASIEQQANPLLRWKPVAVCAYTTPSGCILAASYEAKEKGVKTGMRLRDAYKLCPGLIPLPCDPEKYRYVHMELRKILANYSPIVYPLSIDEFSFDVSDYMKCYSKSPREIALSIKSNIADTIGKFIRVSIGISTNRFLAKLASNLEKPDGLQIIDKNNYAFAYTKSTLRDLNGINRMNEKRLIKVGIRDVLDFYLADLDLINSAFKSVTSKYWYMRLRGFEIDVDVSRRKSYGNSYAIPGNVDSVENLKPILYKLVEKTGVRMRNAGYKAGGVSLNLSFTDGTYWGKSVKLRNSITNSSDIYNQCVGLLKFCKNFSRVRIVAESVFALEPDNSLQMGLFEDLVKKRNLSLSVDKANDKWGGFLVTNGKSLLLKSEIKDRISFGGVRELI